MNTKQVEPKVGGWVEVTEEEYREAKDSMSCPVAVQYTTIIEIGEESQKEAEGQLLIAAAFGEPQHYYKRVNVKGPSGRGTSNG